MTAVSQFTSRDDVFSADFLTGIIGLQSPCESPATLEDFHDLNTSLGNWNVTSVLEVSVKDIELPPGPYFLCGKNIHQAWKLYPDDLDAFQTTVIPENTQSSQTT